MTLRQRFALILCCVTHGQRGAEEACRGSSSISIEEWQAAAELLQGANAGGMENVAILAINDPVRWSQIWMPLGQRVLRELGESLHACPEGALTALLHALPALDEERGDADSLHAVKMLKHHLEAGMAVPRADSDAARSPWSSQWSLAVGSLVRFVYSKWVNIPQEGGEDPGRKKSSFQVAEGTLRRHHELLFQTSLEPFLRSGVYEMAIAENSVLLSEAFAFFSFCRLHSVDLVLESGVYKGYSTEVWSHLVKEVVAVDVAPQDGAEERLSKLSNVRFFRGDGKVLLPRILGEVPSERVAIFIDGPKGELAIHLALQLRKHKQVAFVALHDMAPYRQSMLDLGAYFYSDEPWFQEKFRHLDAPFRMRPDLEAGGAMAFLPGER